MKKVKQQIWLLLLSLLCFCSCESEQPSVEPVSSSEEPYISIAGGNPSEFLVNSRAATAPEKPGVCNADRLKIWVYRGDAGSSLVGAKPTIEDMSLLEDQPEDKTLRFDQKNLNNKVTTHSIIATATRYHTSGYSFPALAYTSADKDKFSYNEETGIKTHGVSLIRIEDNSDCYITPELYFGFLNLDYTAEKGIITMNNRIAVVKHNDGLSVKEYPNSQLTGEIYRVVSQLNLNVSEVDARHLVSMEMYLSNLPLSMTLYGNHGEFYPVEAAKENGNYAGDSNEVDGKVLVCRTTEFPRVEQDGKKYNTAQLSTFILPSEIGRSLTVRLNYDDTVSFGKDPVTGEEIRYKNYEIRPAESHFLTGQDAEAYQEGVNKSGKDITVYDNAKNEFYSIANVKVNISGKFEKVFSETSEVDVQIEVCPSYEASHTFNF